MTTRKEAQEKDFDAKKKAFEAAKGEWDAKQTAYKDELVKNREEKKKGAEERYSKAKKAVTENEEYVAFEKAEIAKLSAGADKTKRIEDLKPFEAQLEKDLAAFKKSQEELDGIAASEAGAADEAKKQEKYEKNRLEREDKKRKL